MRFNVSYVLILPLFDILNCKIDNSKGDMLNLTLWQYLSLFKVKNTYLYYKDYLNYLWFKAQENVSPLLKDVLVSDIPGYYLNDILIEYFPGLIIEEQENATIYGLPIAREYREDIEYIKQGKYSYVSNNYKEATAFRIRRVYLDNSIESVMAQHRVHELILGNSPLLREAFKELIGMNPTSKHIFKMFEQDAEILSPQKREIITGTG